MKDALGHGRNTGGASLAGAPAPFAGGLRILRAGSDGVFDGSRLQAAAAGSARADAQAAQLLANAHPKSEVVGVHPAQAGEAAHVVAGRSRVVVRM